MTTTNDAPSPCPYCHGDGRCDTWVGDHWAFIPCICPIGKEREEREAANAEDAAETHAA